MQQSNLRPFNGANCSGNPKTGRMIRNILKASQVSLTALSNIYILRIPLLICLLILVAGTVMGQPSPTSAAERLKLIEQKKKLDQRSTVNSISFRNIGPSVMSGRIVDVDVNPGDPTEFYAAYATGGLWHTINNGQSFEPVFDNEAVIFIGDIAVNWTASTDTSNRIIWVGTGEVNSSRSSYAGIGVYKTMNGGKTWEYKGLPGSQHIGKILLHPSDPSIAWVAAMGALYSYNKERGVYKTTDGGNSWQHSLYIDEKTGVVDMDINPANPDEIYAAAWSRLRKGWNFEEAGPAGGIYKSTDGGKKWIRLNSGQSGFPEGKGIGRIGIAVYPKDPRIVYAVLDNNFSKTVSKEKKDTANYTLDDFKNISKEKFLQLDEHKLDSFLLKNRFPKKYTAAVIREKVVRGTLGASAVYDYLADANADLLNASVIGAEVYRSDDAGKTWKKTHEKEINTFRTYGYYFGKIYVSPVDEKKLFVLGVEVLESKDGGKNFMAIDKGNVHADHHALWINPKKDSHLINGNDGGINITYDNGSNWYKANAPSVGQFYDIDVDNAKPYNVYGGLQDNGTWYGPSDHKENNDWTASGHYAYKSIGGGDGMQVQVDKRDNKTVYLGYQFGFYARRNLETGAVKGIRARHDLGETPLRFNWQVPILLSSHQPEVLYYGTNKFHRSLNQGDTLYTLSEDLTNGMKVGDVPFGTITTISESPLKFGLLYCGTDDGNVQLSKDGGYTWSLVSKKLPSNLYISRVVASRHKEGRVYVTMNGYREDDFKAYLFVSEDYGSTWKQLGKDLPYEPLNVLVEDPRSEDVLYVGSDGGLYLTNDGGQSFMSWNKGLPHSVPVHDIAIQERENEIVLGTHGRSIYIAKLPEPGDSKSK